MDPPDVFRRVRPNSPAVCSAAKCSRRCCLVRTGSREDRASCPAGAARHRTTAVGLPERLGFRVAASPSNSYPKPSRPFLERSLATLQNIAHGLADILAL